MKRPTISQNESNFSSVKNIIMTSTHTAFIYSKFTIETLEQDVEYVGS